MKTFVLLLTFWYTDGAHVEVIDSDLSGEDCIDLMYSYVAPEGGSLSCEFDEAWQG